MRSSLILVLVLASCGPASEFTSEELAELSKFALGEPPPNPSNRYADDARAAALGQKFFFDTRFSGPLAVASDLGPVGTPGKVACASCHDPARGGADSRSRPGNTSLGAGFTGRNAPTVVNCVYSRWMFWDGRRDTPWSQALGPVESPVEHNFTRLEVAHLIRSIPGYEAEYEAVFGTIPAELETLPPRGKPGDPAFDALTSAQKDLVNRLYANFGKAIEAYERKLLEKDSAFDRFLAGDAAALSPAAKRGAKLFIGKAACAECHSGGTFSDGEFHNTGIRQEGPNVPADDRGRAQGIAQVLANEFNAAGPYSDQAVDGHLAGLTATAADEGAFKTPTLRGVAKTAPYMHTGSLKTLRDVVLFYRDGGHDSGFAGEKDEAMAPLNLSDAEVDDLVAFLESLDGAPLPAEWVSRPELP